MSILLKLCVALLPLVTPGRGGRRWEPCTGKGAAPREPGGALLCTRCRSLMPFEVPGALGQAAVETTEQGSTHKGNSVCNAHRVGTRFKELSSRHLKPFACMYLLALLTKGLTPALGMKPRSRRGTPGLHLARRRATPGLVVLSHEK